MPRLVFCPNMAVSPDIRINDGGSCSEMIWESGQMIDPGEYDFSRLEFLCETLPLGRFPDYAVSDMGCSVVSGKLRSFLDGLGVTNVQYFDASIVEREGEPPKPGYFAANFIGLVDCIDREKTEMDAEPNDDGDNVIIFSIDQLVLKDADFGDNLLCRASHFTGLVLIDEKLKSHFDQSSLEGVLLVSPERWDGINGEI